MTWLCCNGQGSTQAVMAVLRTVASSSPSLSITQPCVRWLLRCRSARVYSQIYYFPLLFRVLNRCSSSWLYLNLSCRRLFILGAVHKIFLIITPLLISVPTWIINGWVFSLPSPFLTSDLPLLYHMVLYTVGSKLERKKLSLPRSQFCSFLSRCMT